MKPLRWSGNVDRKKTAAVQESEESIVCIKDEEEVEKKAWESRKEEGRREGCHG